MPGVDPSAGIHGLLGVEMLETTPERVVLRLPVDWRVHQPYGILHGGVSALLAESAASLGAALAAGPGKGVVGIELNASHLRPLRDGHLTATATPIRVGRTVQVWGIALHEWRGVGRRTRILVLLTLLVLVSSTAIVGYGNLLSTR